MWNNLIRPPELIAELERVCIIANNPLSVLSSNISYLLSKYDVSQKDLSGHFKHIRLSPRSVNSLRAGVPKSVSSVFVCILVAFFNEKYNAGLQFYEMFIDLRERDRLLGK